MSNKRYGKAIALEEAAGRVNSYEYALIYRSGGIQLSSVERSDRTGLFEADSYRSDGCLEARFFSGNGELHLFAFEGDVKAVITDYRGLDKTEYFDEKYALAKQFQLGSNESTKTTLVVRRLLDTDEDGQTVIRQTGLAGLEA